MHIASILKNFSRRKRYCESIYGEAFLRRLIDRQNSLILLLLPLSKILENSIKYHLFYNIFNHEVLNIYMYIFFYSLDAVTCGLPKMKEILNFSHYWCRHLSTFLKILNILLMVPSIFQCLR